MASKVTDCAHAPEPLLKEEAQNELSNNHVNGSEVVIRNVTPPKEPDEADATQIVENGEEKDLSCPPQAIDLQFRNRNDLDSAPSSGHRNDHMNGPAAIPNGTPAPVQPNMINADATSKNADSNTTESQHREVPPWENTMRGITRNGKKFEVRANHVYIGGYSSVEEAICARNAAFECAFSEEYNQATPEEQKNAAKSAARIACQHFHALDEVVQDRTRTNSDATLSDSPARKVPSRPKKGNAAKRQSIAGLRKTRSGKWEVMSKSIYIGVYSSREEAICAWTAANQYITDKGRNKLGARDAADRALRDWRERKDDKVDKATAATVGSSKMNFNKVGLASTPRRSPSPSEEYKDATPEERKDGAKDTGEMTVRGFRRNNMTSQDHTGTNSDGRLNDAPNEKDRSPSQKGNALMQWSKNEGNDRVATRDDMPNAVDAEILDTKSPNNANVDVASSTKEVSSNVDRDKQESLGSPRVTGKAPVKPYVFSQENTERKWHAMVTQLYIGSYHSKEEAHCAAGAAADCLNSPECTQAGKAGRKKGKEAAIKALVNFDKSRGLNDTETSRRKDHQSPARKRSVDKVIDVSTKRRRISEFKGICYNREKKMWEVKVDEHLITYCRSKNEALRAQAAATKQLYDFVQDAKEAETQGFDREAEDMPQKMSDPDAIDVLHEKVTALAKVCCETMEEIDEKVAADEMVITGHTYSLKLDATPSSPSRPEWEFEATPVHGYLSELVANWQYEGDALEEPLDFFNDNLDLTLQTFQDVKRLLVSMPKISDKWGAFARDTSANRSQMRMFLSNMEKIQVALGEIHVLTFDHRDPVSGNAIDEAKGHVVRGWEMFLQELGMEQQPVRGSLRISLNSGPTPQDMATFSED